MKSTICGALVAREMTLSLALSIRDPVESGATPATNGPDITAGRCTTHRWRDPHWTKEFKLMYWGVLFVLYRVFPHHNNFLCGDRGLLPWVRLATCPETSAARFVAVDLQLAYPNSSLLLLLLHLLGAVLAVASIC